MRVPNPLEAMMDTEEARRYLTKYRKKEPEQGKEYKVNYYAVSSFFPSGITAR